MHIYCFSESTKSKKITPQGQPIAASVSMLDAFLPLLEQLGTVVVLDTLDSNFKSKCQLHMDGKESVYLFAFAPPDHIPRDLPCHVIPVFPWAYPTIADVQSEPGSSRNLPVSLKGFSTAMTYSSFAREAINEATDSMLQVAVIPAPIWDQWSETRLESVPVKPVKKDTLRLNKVVVDSMDYALAGETIYPGKSIISPLQDVAKRRRDSGRVEAHFGSYSSHAMGVGFYGPEGWGMWSRSLSPWIKLSHAVRGKTRFKLALSAHGPNIGREIQVSIGGQTTTIIPESQVSEFEFLLDIQASGNVLRFDNLSRINPKRADDPRTMGIGVASLSILTEEAGGALSSDDVKAADFKSLHLQGVVYTALVEPADRKDCWKDIILAFCLALRREHNANLILVVERTDLLTYINDLLELWCKLTAFDCRIIAVQGVLNTAERSALIEASSFIVNNASAESYCQSLMDFMSCGIPAIAPNHTAMKDYISSENAFVVESNSEPCSWPDDLEGRYNTLCYRPNWESLLQAFENSFTVANKSPDTYEAMSKAAICAQKVYCSLDSTSSQLRDFLAKVQ